MANQNLLYYCTVCDNQDPDGMGRIRVSLPEIDGGSDIQTDWLPVLSPFTGDQSGFFALPETDDIVGVLFMDNELQKGIVLGSLWNSTQLPPASEENADGDFNDDGNNNLHFIRSRSGLRIILDDSDGEEKIQLLSTDASTRLEILVGEEMLNIETEGDITISAKGGLNIEAEEIQTSTEDALSMESENLQQKAGSDSEFKGDSGIAMEGNGVGLN